jgi:hypothetical protein|tara:strand:- start:177 stop:386 length:210 start_codon:yes stop_codon:yes gene_type:complete
MTNNEISEMTEQMMKQLDQLENDRDNYKRLAETYAKQNRILSRRIEKIQKLLDVERTVTHNLTDPDRYI